MAMMKDLDEPEVFQEAMLYDEADELSGPEAFEEATEFEINMESKHEHLLPIESDQSMLMDYKPTYQGQIMVEEVDSESEHPVLESRNDIAGMTSQDTTRHSERTGGRSCHSKETIDPYDYMDSLHSRLGSTHFRRDERNEDYIDFLFEKIESVACEMDGRPETVKDILDEAFEFLEDVACGKMARKRHSTFRASFEQFLQQIDRLAALAPKEDVRSDPDENKDLLDVLCHHFEKAACDKDSSNANFFGADLFSKELVVDVLAYVNACTAKKTTTTTTNVKPSVHSLLSVSEASSEGIERFKDSLFKISEESSFVSSDQSLRSGRKKVEDRNSQRDEFMRRNNLRRLRGNIHGRVSKKNIVKKVSECRDTMHEAFGSAGEQISMVGARLVTIFESIEMEKLWETFVLGLAFSSTSNNEERSDETDTTFHLAPSEDPSMEHITTEPEKQEPPHQNLTLEMSTRSRDVIEPRAVDVHDTCMIMHDSKHCKDLRDDRDVILATSSEETYASGCGSGRSGSSSRRFQQVEDMRKIKKQFKSKMSEFGRLTPDSAMTEPTCDETISVVSDMENEHVVHSMGARRLKMIDSESSRLDRMEMLVYMSIHDRKEKFLPMEGHQLTEGSERSREALSVDAAFSSSIPVDHLLQMVPKSVSLDALPPRPTTKKNKMPAGLGNALAEICRSSNRLNQPSSLEGKTSGSFVELDPELGRASNRSNRSLFLQDSGSVSAVSIDETFSIPHIATVPSGLLEEDTTKDKDTKPMLSVAESFCESFVSAKQSEDSDESENETQPSTFKQEDESVASFSSAKSRIPKSRSSQIPLVLEEGPEDELHRVISKTRFSQANQEENAQNTNAFPQSTAVSTDSGPADKSWFGLVTDMFKSKGEGSWFGSQTVKVMMLLLYVSASVEATSNAPEKHRFEERKRQFQEKMSKRAQSEEGVSR